MGIYELLLVSDDTRKLIMEGRSSAEIHQHARDNGMTTILEDGLIKVEQGLTTRDEVFRVGH